jgi:hypothetical protein
MARRDVTYEALAVRLEGLGLHYSPASIRYRIRNGRFSAIFLAQCCEAMGIRYLGLTSEER